MRTLHLYNSLSREVESIEPLEPTLRMYCCGPTVYNYAHIGNFRTYMAQDLLRRTLLRFGYQLRHVMQFTDVDDKTIRGAREAGLPLSEFTKYYADAFCQDMDTLAIQRPEAQPNATDHIAEMIALIERLLIFGAAYVSDDGSVYYRIAAFTRYGCLCRLDREGMQPGARVLQDEYQKESVADFALWKAWTEEDGDVKWDSPWGPGRPGWHIECSAISIKHLGESFDIHGGGIDLLFPHHENEIAQSEAATGKPFVKYWTHCAHLLVEGQKMSKSLGNLYTVRDLIELGYAGRDIRYALLHVHYRQQLNFTQAGLHDARATVGRIDEWVRRVRPVAVEGEVPDAFCNAFLEEFDMALADDLNISAALGYFFDFIRTTNRALDAGDPPEGLLAVWRAVDSILGLGNPPDGIPADVQALVDARAAARAAKDFAQSDALRDQILALGWQVKDTAHGQEVVPR